MLEPNWLERLIGASQAGTNHHETANERVPGKSPRLQSSQREAPYDSKWGLRTNTDLPASAVALQYKHLLTVERFFRMAEEERMEAWMG